MTLKSVEIISEIVDWVHGPETEFELVLKMDHKLTAKGRYDRHAQYMAILNDHGIRYIQQHRTTRITMLINETCDLGRAGDIKHFDGKRTYYLFDSLGDLIRAKLLV